MCEFSSLEYKRVLLWYVLYFFGLRRLNWMKKEPPGVVFVFFRLRINMKNILSVLYAFVMLVKQQEQNIEFTVVSPISHTQMDIFE